MKVKTVLITMVLAAAALSAGWQQGFAGAPVNGPKKAKPVKPVPKPPKLRPTLYSGRAVGLDLTNTLTATAWRLAETGPLPAHGGAIDVIAGATNLENVLSVDGAHVSVSGVGGVSFSTADVTNVMLSFVQDGVTNVIALAAAAAQARAECGSNGLALTASSQVQGLTINGVSAVVTGETNQVIAIPGGSLVLNAQVTSSGKGGEITVAALFLMLTNGLQGSIAHAEADIKCGSAVPPGMRACDKVTGGGFVITSITDTNTVSTNVLAHGSFGLMAGNKHGQLVGRLNYIDHGMGMTVTSTGVTGFTVIDAVARAIDFNVTIDGVPGTAHVIVADNGEPGRNDVFDITLSNGYHAGGNLRGGNIQLHKCPPGWAK